MSFFYFPPNPSVATTIEQSCVAENHLNTPISKKPIVFNFRFKNCVLKTAFQELFLNENLELSILTKETAKLEYDSFSFNSLRVAVSWQKNRFTESLLFDLLLDQYFKTDTKSEIKSILKNTVFATWQENQLCAIWIKKIINKHDAIIDVIELLDCDFYSNYALLNLGEKLLKVIPQQANKYQNLFHVYFKIGNCYFHKGEPKKAYKYYKKAAGFLNYTDVHHHFIYYFKLVKTKRNLGLNSIIEEQKLMYFYMSKENWEKKLYKNDLKEYFQISA